MSSKRHNNYKNRFRNQKRYEPKYRNTFTQRNRPKEIKKYEKKQKQKERKQKQKQEQNQENVDLPFSFANWFNYIYKKEDIEESQKEQKENINYFSPTKKYLNSVVNSDTNMINRIICKVPNDNFSIKINDNLYKFKNIQQFNNDITFHWYYYKSSRKPIRNNLNLEELNSILTILIKQKKPIINLYNNCKDQKPKIKNNIFDKKKGILYIAEGTEEIKHSQFKNRKDIRLVVFPESLKIICNCAFQYCSNIEYLKIPNGVKEIDYFAFYDCYSLKVVNLPKNLCHLGSNSFKNCLSLKKIYFPDSLIEIGKRAFINCISLEVVNLPKNLIKLEYDTFKNCLSLTTVRFPEKMNSIGPRNFEDCSSLKTICLPENLTEFCNTIFFNCNRLSHVMTNKNYSDSDFVLEGLNFDNIPFLKKNGGEGVIHRDSIKPSRRFHWHWTMHDWCPTQQAKDCIFALFICEKRLDRKENSELVSLDHEVWQHILTFVRRDEFGN